MLRALKALTVAFALTAALTAGVGAAGAQAPPSMLRGTFKVLFPKGHPASNAPCPSDAFCGAGALVGFGPATVTILDESFADIEGSSCLAVERTESIDLLDGSGSLVIQSSGTFCRPGGSGDSHAGPQSYGSPGRFLFSFTVDGADSTGVFAGATGDGTEEMNVSGGVGVWLFSGRIALS
jgi:hypothetical protein